jgi:hypothetical protein
MGIYRSEVITIYPDLFWSNTHDNATKKPLDPTGENWDIPVIKPRHGDLTVDI